MQLDELTEELFAQQLNTKFYVLFEERRVELELVGVEGDKSSMEKVKGVERFAVYFLGPEGIYLPQYTYRIEHEALGELAIFIVPVGKDKNRFRYEAVFSRLTDKD
jgi:hypothetical protein